MHLLNARTKKLEYFVGSNVPLYAILSHTWGEDEVSMQDLTTDPNVESKEGYTKIRFTCDQAIQHDIEYAWVDTCCIDKTSSAELSEAINSMYNWYKRAEICYAYLSDVFVRSSQSDENTGPIHERLTPADLSRTLVRKQKEGLSSRIEDEEELEMDERTMAEFEEELEMDERTMAEFTLSRWFTRGWTLQELIAPRDVYFFGQGWNYIGSRKGSLLGKISEITGVNRILLDNPGQLTEFSVAQKMSWASSRRTTRKEDEAYCLLGIFGVNMPLLYGEEERAFIRLQKEIIRASTDQTIFAWDLVKPNGPWGPAWDYVAQGDGRLLAPSPCYFANSGNIRQSPPHDNLGYIGFLQCHDRGRLLGLILHNIYKELPEEPLEKRLENLHLSVVCLIDRNSWTRMVRLTPKQVRDSGLRLKHVTIQRLWSELLVGSSSTWRHKCLWIHLINENRRRIWNVQCVYPAAEWQFINSGASTDYAPTFREDNTTILRCDYRDTGLRYPYITISNTILAKSFTISASEGTSGSFGLISHDSDKEFGNMFEPSLKSHQLKTVYPDAFSKLKVSIVEEGSWENEMVIEVVSERTLLGKLKENVFRSKSSQDTQSTP